MWRIKEKKYRDKKRKTVKIPNDLNPDQLHPKKVKTCVQSKHDQLAATNITVDFTASRPQWPPRQNRNTPGTILKTNKRRSKRSPVEEKEKDVGWSELGGVKTGL